MARTMPSPAHETLVALLSQWPELLDLLLRTLGRPGTPGGFTDIDATRRAADPLEVRPDLILAGEGDEAGWVIVEVQLAIDPDKRRRWLAAASMMLDARRVMGDLVVITHDASVARWAARVGRALGPTGTRLMIEPVVVLLSRAEVATLLASGRPELAPFVAWAVHDQQGRRAQEAVRAAVDLVAGADAPLHGPLVRAMLSMLGDPLLTVVREMMMRPMEIPESEGFKALRREIEAIGEARGEARGVEEALVLVLGARGFILDDATRARLARCQDVAVLRRWVARAATAASLAEVFDVERPG